jgi:hypothetical protein
MRSMAANVVVWPRCLQTLAIRSRHRKGAGEFLLEVGQRAIFLVKRPDYGRCAPCAPQATGSDTR